MAAEASLRLELAGRWATLTFDSPGRPVNVLDSDAIQQLERLLDILESSHGLAGLILLSAKPRVFLAGADLDELASVDSAETARPWVERGQAAVSRLARLPFPTLAAVAGAALGGGCEMALACTYRIAADLPAVIFAQPEAQLGLCPALGATWRLPRRVGLARALDLLLTGRRLTAREAYAAGLVDEVVPAPVLLAAAERRLAERPRPRRGGGVLGRLWADNPLGRALVVAAAARRARRAGGARYPAPAVILQAVRRGGQRAEAVEAARFGELATSPASRALVHLFRLTRAAAGEERRGAKWPIAVLGAGFMGAGIAAVAARAGHPVRLLDSSTEALGRALAANATALASARRHGRISEAEERAARARVRPTVEPRGCGAAALVVEAVFEDLALKRSLLARVAAEAAPGTVLASNTSTLPIASLAAGLPHPERVLGLHFFSPVARMPVVEIVRPSGVAEEAIVRARAFVRGLGKTPVVVGDGPGFYTTRIVGAYTGQAVELLMEGHGIAAIDAAGRAAGFPVGPLALLDEVGLDVAARAAGTLAAAFPGRFATPEPLAALVAAGRLGRKSHLGFYDYRATVKRADEEAAARLRSAAPAKKSAGATAALADRLLWAMVAEAVRALDDGVLDSPGDGDLAAVLGVGFPPFLGGPFFYLDSLGAPPAMARLARLAEAGGAAYEPPRGLVERARDEGRFHG
ncbi:MAG: 3-hydroxyacyl-CoA dehydrogenase NAD-binding domain-containing protein [Thermoanaerobaculia bacterium]